MKIYTKSGDNGFSALMGKEKIQKSDPVFEFLGSLDEFNAILGFLHSTRNKKLKSHILQIQSDIFELGSVIAVKNVSLSDKNYFSVRTSQIEQSIDQISNKLPPLKNFILPGGSTSSCYLHLARAKCREAERLFVKYSTLNNFSPKEIGIYLNRLSDFLFVLARETNYNLGVKDPVWKKNEK